MLPWTSSAIGSRGKSADMHRYSRREMAPAPGNDAMGKVEGNRLGKRNGGWDTYLLMPDPPGLLLR
jgi:hypothetical protein